MQDEIMTIEEVARYLHIKKSQVYIYANREINPLPMINITHITKRVSRQSLMNWLQENEGKL